MDGDETSYANRGTSNANTRRSLNGSFATNRWNDQDERENNNSRQPQRDCGRASGGYHGNRQQDGNRNFDKHGASISYQKIEDLCKDIDKQKILPGSIELLTAVRVQSFYNRLDDPDLDIKEQSNFLRVIVAAASTIKQNLLHLTHDFVLNVLKSKLLENVVNDCICPLKYDDDKQMQQEPIYADIAHHTVKLMVLGFDLLPSKMDVHLSKVENIITILNKLEENFLDEATKIQLGSLEISVKSRYEAKLAQRVTAKIQKNENQAFEGFPGEPPTNFRQLSIVPTPKDISYECTPYLRPIKSRGQFESVEQYLDIHFRLLHEDLIRPLRDGINAYRTGEKCENKLFVYNIEKIDAPLPDSHEINGELISCVYINTSRINRWDKRLKVGSLVCLSSDDFQQVFLFATVLRHDSFAKGEIGLKFEEFSQINTNQKYKMVESPAFFEAYRPVMMALQTIKVGEPIAFSKYLVNVETDTVPPLYSVDQLFDFKSLLKTKIMNTEYYLHQLNGLEPKDFNMDDSQFDALIYVLSSQLAILQGPPGTGKTYMGLKITKLLLDNWTVLNPDPQDSRPILVVCYTNHALDQFLEGISQFVSNGIIRVGGQCKNKVVVQFLIKDNRKLGETPLRKPYYEKQEEAKTIQKDLEEHAAILKKLKTRFVDPHLLRSLLYVPEKRYYQSILNFDKTYTHVDTETLMSKWLTQTDHTNPIQITDIEIIRQLMIKKIPEIQAKNALAYAHRKYGHFDAFHIESLISHHRVNFSSAQLDRFANKWPKISDIDRVKEMGFPEKVAVELLLRSSVEEIYEEYNIKKEDRIVDGKRQTTYFTLQNVEYCDKKWYNEETMKDCLKHITSACPMTEEEADLIEDVWKLPLQQRWRLYQNWIKKCRKAIKAMIEKKEKEYNEKLKEVSDVRSVIDIEVFKNAKVVGMTTTGAAKHQNILRDVRPRIVIVEEAAEVLEAHLVACLTTGCEHLILIGDHKQLRPSPVVHELAKKYNLEVSLFERLINNGYPYCMLKNQHRMCTDISRVLMPHFYENLLDDPSVFEKESVKGVTKNLMFINHSHSEQTEKEFKSHKNEYEAEFALRLAQYFVQQNYKQNQITILCTYLDQLLVLRRKAVARFGKNHAFVIESVDNYQGEENDIVILSLVRSNNPENKIGFLNIPNRVCVALSRAKLGLYVICNMDFLSKNCEMWNQIRRSATEAGALSDGLVVTCQMHGNEQTIMHFNDFDSKCPDGGCNVSCNGRLQCGHTCSKPCHVEDMEHQNQKCFKPCNRRCDSEFKHPCKNICCQPCGRCLVKVLKQLPCGHEKLDYCHLNPEIIQCDEACQLILPCGHQCKETCVYECTKHCKEKVQRRLPGCGHTVTVECSKDLSSFKCKEKVVKKWPLCNHTAEIECSSDVSTLPCPHPCNTVLPDCQHLCKGCCGSCRNGRLHIACSEKCNKIFLCEHQCETKCSKICPPCDKPCETACGHNQCGNQPINEEQMKKTRQLLDSKRGSRTGRKCGEPCPPCMEECLNRCEHRQCSNRCGEPCDVKPCNEPCMKLLPCNGASGYYVQHRCIGVCGEDCPKICKICDYKKLGDIQKNILFVTVDKENARFVELKDCGHIIEVTVLDQSMQSSFSKDDDDNSPTEIVQIKCPQCNTPIRRSKRYISILNERAIDIEQIKQKTRGLTSAEKKREQEVFQKEVEDVFQNFSATKFCYSVEIMKLEKKFNEANSNVMTKNWFSTSRNILRILHTFSKYLKAAEESIENFVVMGKIKFTQNMKKFKAKLGELKITNFWRFLLNEFDNLIQKMDPFEISEYMLQQISYEVQRFSFITDLFSYFSEAINCNVDFKPAEIQMISTIFEDLNGNNEFDDAFAKEISGKLQNLAKSHPVSNFGISKKERVEIIKALSSHITHWYKCPNGHHYGISGCGEAVTKSKCPECQAEIGGESHQLLHTNQDAQDEMFEGTGITARRRNHFEARW